MRLFPCLLPVLFSSLVLLLLPIDAKKHPAEWGGVDLDVLLQREEELRLKLNHGPDYEPRSADVFGECRRRRSLALC